MKTAIIFLDPAEGFIQYFVVDGDQTRFHDVFINLTTTGKEDDLLELMYGEEGALNYEPVTIDAFRRAIWYAGAELIECGFCS